MQPKRPRHAKAEYLGGLQTVQIFCEILSVVFQMFPFFGHPVKFPFVKNSSSVRTRGDYFHFSARIIWEQAVAEGILDIQRSGINLDPMLIEMHALKKAKIKVNDSCLILEY